MSEFQFPKVHVTRQYEEGGRIYEEAVTPPVCDMCFDTRVTWDYSADDFVIEEIDFASAGGWALCDECARLVEGRHLPELTARLLYSWSEIGIPYSDQLVDKAGETVQAFFDHLHPGRVAFG